MSHCYNACENSITMLLKIKLNVKNVNNVKYLWDHTSVREGNEVFLTRVWKLLPSIRVLKLWGWWQYKTGQSGQYLLVLGLCCYKWHKSQTSGGLSLKGGWTLGGVPARTLGIKGGWIVRSHIDWREERVSARTLVLKGGGLWDPTLVGERTETFFIRVWNPLLNRRILKTSRESSKEKAQREDNISRWWVWASLGCYIFYSL